jgi:hypothetical protein
VSFRIVHVRWEHSFEVQIEIYRAESGTSETVRHQISYEAISPAMDVQWRAVAFSTRSLSPGMRRMASCASWKQSRLLTTTISNGVVVVPSSRKPPT